MNPKKAIEKFVEDFNNADENELAEFYHDDDINHQVNTEPL